ncbi:MAG: caspase family protein [Pirellulaceae bacterium]
MELVFQDIVETNPAAVLERTLQLIPARAEDEGRRDLALYVLEHGLAALSQGAGPIECIVLPKTPTFDDMLAAELVQRQLACEAIPEAAEAFARYAALAREGLRPGSAPLENSIEGVYLAILNSVGEDLTDKEVSRRFVERWRPMAQRVMQAIDEGEDPFKAPLFDESKFGRELAFLSSDHKVYREDVARGEKWLIVLPTDSPTHPGEKSAALVLRRPKSLLFKHWCRTDAESPTGRGYLLLAVQWADRNWVFSTDPVQRLSLKPLCVQLQQAEIDVEADSAANNPWFDGARFEHTLVAAPKGGAQLSDERILNTVRRWTSATPVSSASPRIRRPRLLAGIVASIVLVASLALFVFVPGDTSVNPRGLEILESDRDTQVLPPEGEDHAIFIATDNYDAPEWTKLSNAVADAKAIRNVLVQQYGFKEGNATLLIDKPRDDVIEEIQKFQDYSQLKYLQPEDRLFVFIAGHGYYNGQRKDGYIVMKDSQSPKKPKWWKSYIDHDDLRTTLEKLDCRHVFVVIDACYSATFDAETAIEASRGPSTETESAGAWGVADLGSLIPSLRGGPDARIEKAKSEGVYRQVAKSEYVRRKLQFGCKRFLTSGRGPVSDGVAGEHSPFARKFLEVLTNGGGEDGIVTGDEVVDAAMKVEESEPGVGFMNGDEHGDFLFIRR